MGSEMTFELFEKNRTERRELLKYVLTTCNAVGFSTLSEADYDNINVYYVLDQASKGLAVEVTDAFVTSTTTEEEEPEPEEEVPPAELPSNDLQTDYNGGVYLEDLCLDLLPFETGLSEDDLRETAYEVLLASVGAAGGLKSLTKEKKEETVSRSGKWKSHSSTSGLASLMNIMRLQLQINEECEKRTTEALFHASNGRLGKRIDSLLLPLELLCNISREGFSDPGLYPLWQKRQLNILKEGILNNSYWKLDRSDHLAIELMASILNVEDSVGMSSKGRADALKRIRDVYLAILERSGKPEDFCHWADGYYLNVRLYEKLLYGVFDNVKRHQFIEEAEEVMELLKSTWRVMGITQTVHDTCYTWILFKQFVSTGEFALLQHAARQMKRIATDRQRSTSERMYLRTHAKNGLSYVQSVLKPIKAWIDNQLNDYHLHFLHDRIRMEALLSVAMTSARLLADEETVMPKATSINAKQAESYVSSSIQQAYSRALEAANHTNVNNNKRLVYLAERVKKLAEHDISSFSPLFSRWGHLSPAVTATVLHTSYYKELKPVLEKLSVYSDDEVTAVLSAADELEKYLVELVASVDKGDERINEYKSQMTHYEVENISGNLSMRCIKAKLEELERHVESAFIEESWEAWSEQRYGRSASLIFEAIDKVVEDFFSMKLPVSISYLKDLKDGLENALQLYSKKLLAQLGDKADLIPPAPALARHKKELSIRSLAKKKVTDPRLLDEKRSKELNTFTTAKLCVHLNTLHFILNQLEVVENNMRQRWVAKRPQRKQNMKPKQSEEIFPDFDASKKAVGLALEQTCEFTGFKLIFWDMRETYVDSMYKGSVTQCRIEKVVNGLDTILGQLCEVLIEPLRDQVVYGLLEASLEGFLWVLLDGGPFRSFSQADADILEQDLNALKEFFVADGDGLPRGVVNNAAAQVHQIINLYKLETHVVVESFRRANEQSVNPVKNASLVPDSEILLRVLCHRKDKEATKFLKQCKLPKH